jgi:NAD(P)-dependent dehydrogenase (short-subunit alcohol dehydrogenase family)
LKPYTGN